jgi:hypothetical protein
MLSNTSRRSRKSVRKVGNREGPKGNDPNPPRPHAGLQRLGWIARILSAKMAQSCTRTGRMWSGVAPCGCIEYVPPPPRMTPFYLPRIPWAMIDTGIKALMTYALDHRLTWLKNRNPIQVRQKIFFLQGVKVVDICLLDLLAIFLSSLNEICILWAIASIRLPNLLRPWGISGRMHW